MKENALKKSNLKKNELRKKRIVLAKIIIKIFKEKFEIKKIILDN